MSRIEKYIRDILYEEYLNDEIVEEVYKKSEVLQYFNLKSNAIHGNVKSRRSLANWYAIYSILHFYVEYEFVDHKEQYLQFEGFTYMELFRFMRAQYGGEKLQNHALNSRVNGEFLNKIASDKEKQLILIHDGKYLLNPSYLFVNNKDLVPLYIKVVKKYIDLLKEKDHALFGILKELKMEYDVDEQKNTLAKLLTEDSEARVFEIVSYAILANHYKKQKVYIGNTLDELEERYLKLYKTGRTNANDGGIDFVMRPLGRFFQVTEVGSYNKYFLDIDKVLRFPITFVVKTRETSHKIKKDLVNYADTKSGGHKVIKKKYIQAIEEIITINELSSWLDNLGAKDIQSIILDIELYYRLELHISDDD